MDLTEYIKSKGLTTRLVAQEAGISRQALNQYGKAFTPSAKTLKKIATAMTNLGVETTVVDLIPCFFK